MKSIKKVLAFLMAGIMAVTALCITASAEPIGTNATAIKSGKSYSAKLIGFEAVDYKISVAKAGQLKLKLKSSAEATVVTVVDEDGAGAYLTDISNVSGEFRRVGYAGNDQAACRDSRTEIYSGTFTFEVKKGTYYIRLKGYYNNTNGTADFTATFPSASSSNSSSYGISYFSIPMEVGDRLKLGTVLYGDTYEDIVWTSSKNSVATVSSTGKVTAKSEGSTIITAKLGNSSVSIKIKVTD